MRARDELLRIGDVGRRDPVHHLGRRVAQHALGADIEDLDDALRVGGDAREVGAVEDRALQRARLEQRLLRLLARGVVGADQQVADDGVSSSRSAVTDTTAGKRLPSLRMYVSS
jgi:hypothetical protein